ncbi:hypothetical protein SAMD00023353_5000510 [Rosellinia necatrix]|uniref:Uncharacterized protein n=1 Tax=Rosellinia necatrix TaxID=77044 RepID=A0A1W2TQ65_ROSNE|nr:hypothetical protein SAMD00023353_5000510 [Rosellinia necatrix]
MASNESPGSNGTADYIAPSAGDTKFFATMFKYLPKNIDIDWDQFAQEMGFKNSEVAKVRCRQIRLKLGLTGAGSSNAPSTPTKSGTTAKSVTPKSVTPKSGNANKVTKPRGKAKVKQPKSFSEVIDEAVNHTVANTLKNEEVAPDYKVAPDIDDDDRAFI